MREDTVRLWRSDFAGGGLEALKASVADRSKTQTARGPRLNFGAYQASEREKSRKSSLRGRVFRTVCDISAPQQKLLCQADNGDLRPSNANRRERETDEGASRDQFFTRLIGDGQFLVRIHAYEIPVQELHTFGNTYRRPCLIPPRDAGLWFAKKQAPSFYQASPMRLINHLAEELLRSLQTLIRHQDRRDTTIFRTEFYISATERFLERIYAIERVGR